jgi:hypothetical protein
MPLVPRQRLDEGNPSLGDFSPKRLDLRDAVVSEAVLECLDSRAFRSRRLIVDDRNVECGHLPGEDY